MSVNEANVVRYRIDAGRSQFIVQATASGLLSAFGHNPSIAIRGFGGDAKLVPGTLEAASLLMLVSADSLAVANKVSDKDRREIERMMHEEVLETTRYPEIVFMSANITGNQMRQGQYRVRINGNLSLHGVTRNCPIDAQVTVNEDNLRAQGEFSLRQTDYQISPISVVGGTLKVKDELKFSFDISAIAD
jgi:polyisoprenoid-binding protein YceI